MTKVKGESTRAQWGEDVGDSAEMAWVRIIIVGVTTSTAKAGTTKDEKTGVERDSLTRSKDLMHLITTKEDSTSSIRVEEGSPISEEEEDSTSPTVEEEDSASLTRRKGSFKTTLVKTISL